MHGIMSQKGYQSILQRRAIPYGLHLIAVNHAAGQSKTYFWARQSQCGEEMEEAGGLSLMAWQGQLSALNPI